jgi:hypothetical protein
MKLVEVIWWDTNETSNSGWCSEEEAKQARPCRVASVGWLINESHDFITIAADIDANIREDEKDDLLGRVQCFPMGCVIKVNVFERHTLDNELIN